MSGSPEVRPAHWAKPGPKPQPFNPDRCGEMAGYKRHQRAGLPTCAACRAAATAKETARKAKAQALSA